MAVNVRIKSPYPKSRVQSFRMKLLHKLVLCAFVFYLHGENHIPACRAFSTSSNQNHQTSNSRTKAQGSQQYVHDRKLSSRQSRKVILTSTIAACAILFPFSQPQPAHAALPGSSGSGNDFFSRARQSEYSTDKHGFSSIQNDARKAKVMQEIIELQDLQDSRLDKCVDRGQDWEQCFMFGDSVSSTFADGQGNDWDWSAVIRIPSPLNGSSLPPPPSSPPEIGARVGPGLQEGTRMKPPTW